MLADEGSTTPALGTGMVQSWYEDGGVDKLLRQYPDHFLAHATLGGLVRQWRASEIAIVMYLRMLEGELDD